MLQENFVEDKWIRFQVKAGLGLHSIVYILISFWKDICTTSSACLTERIALDTLTLSLTAEHGFLSFLQSPIYLLHLTFLELLLQRCLALHYLSICHMVNARSHEAIKEFVEGHFDTSGVCVFVSTILLRVTYFCVIEINACNQIWLSTGIVYGLTFLLASPNGLGEYTAYRKDLRLTARCFLLWRQRHKLHEYNTDKCLPAEWY